MMNCARNPGILAFLSMLMLLMLVMMGLGKFPHPKAIFSSIDSSSNGSIHSISASDFETSSGSDARVLQELRMKDRINLAYREAVEILGSIASALATFEPIIVPTIVHIAKDTDLNITNDAEGKEQEQIDFMNQAFSDNNMKITFDLIGVRTHVNSEYFNEPCPRCNGWEGYSPMLENTREGDSNTLNIYFNNGPPFGYAMLGESFGYRRFHDGVIVNHSTIKGGSHPRKNFGEILIHEVGHWLGLDHTFRGYDCKGNGDGVSDTPPQGSPTGGSVNCSAPVEDYPDTCPGDEFPDPIHNYMNYGPCMSEFTPGQALKCHITWELARKAQGDDLQNTLPWEDVVVPEEPINVVITAPTNTPATSPNLNTPVVLTPPTPSPTRGLRDPQVERQLQSRPDTDRLRPQPNRLRPTMPPTEPILEDTKNCPAMWPGDGTECVMVRGFNRKKCIYYEYSADSICTCSIEDPFWTCVSSVVVLPEEEPTLSLGDLSVVSINRNAPP